MFVLSIFIIAYELSNSLPKWSTAWDLILFVGFPIKLENIILTIKIYPMMNNLAYYTLVLVTTRELFITFIAGCGI